MFRRRRRRQLFFNPVMVETHRVFFIQYILSRRMFFDGKQYRVVSRPVAERRNETAYIAQLGIPILGLFVIASFNAPCGAHEFRQIGYGLQMRQLINAASCIQVLMKILP